MKSYAVILMDFTRAELTLSIGLYIPCMKPKKRWLYEAYGHIMSFKQNKTIAI